MSSTEKHVPHESAAEQASRWLRNINALGALVFGAAAVLAPPVAAGAFGTLAGIDAVQAGGFELLRKQAHKRREQSRAQASGTAGNHRTA